MTEEHGGCNECLYAWWIVFRICTRTGCQKYNYARWDVADMWYLLMILSFNLIISASALVVLVAFLACRLDMLSLKMGIFARSCHSTHSRAEKMNCFVWKTELLSLSLQARWWVIAPPSITHKPPGTPVSLRDPWVKLSWQVTVV